MIFIWLMLTSVFVKPARIQCLFHKDGCWIYQTCILLDFNLLQLTKQLVEIFLIMYLTWSLQKSIFRISWKLGVLRAQSQRLQNLLMASSINIALPRIAKFQPKMETQLCSFCVALWHSMVSTISPTSTQRNSIPGTNSTMRTFQQWVPSKMSGKSASPADRSPQHCFMRERTSSQVCCLNTGHRPKTSISMKRQSKRTTSGCMGPLRKKVFVRQLCND